MNYHKSILEFGIYGLVVAIVYCELVLEQRYHDYAQNGKQDAHPVF